MKASAGTSRTPLPGMTTFCPAQALRATRKTLRKELRGGLTVEEERYSWTLLHQRDWPFYGD